MAVIGLVHQNPFFPHVFEAAAHKGHKLVHLASPHDNFVNRFFPGVIASHDLDIFADEEKAIAEATSIRERYGIEGFISFREEAMPFTARLCDRLGMSSISPEAAEQARDKRRMRQAFQRHGVRCPKFVRCTVEDWRARFESAQIPFPVVVKPTLGFGSIGVIEAGDMASLAAAVEQAQVIIRKKLSKFTSQPEFLIEQFIGGGEYIVDSVCHLGKAHIVGLAYKGIPRGPYFEERFHLTMPPLQAEVLQDVYVQVSGALAALGISEGPSHTEIKIEGDKTYIIEVGARIGGSGQVHWLVEESTGVDFLGLTFDHCLGRLDTTGLTPIAQAKACVSNYNIRAGGGGVFREIGGLVQAARTAPPQRFIFMWQPGFKVTPYPDFCGFPGFILSKHVDFETGLGDIERYDREVVVQYD